MNGHYYVEVVKYYLDGRMEVHERHGPYPRREIADNVKVYLEGVINTTEFFVRVVTQ